MKCHYEVLGVSPDCTADDLKKAYRKSALEWHPDKNLHRLAEATEAFQLIQQAYETLIDPQERAWYDRHKEDILRGAEEAYKDNNLNVYQYFNASCFKGYNDDEKGFYTVYRQVFETIAAEDKPFLDSDEEIDVPSFGYSDSSYEEVVHDFYAYWQSYCTAKSYSWVDQFSLTEARKSGVGRQVIRLMEKDNKKLRDQHKKARNEEVRALVAFVRKRDKRVQAHKKKEEEKKIEKAKRAEELRKQQVLERNKSLENYKESEWSSKSGLEAKFDELESTIDAAFGTASADDAEDAEDDISALYCVACEKDFRSEKAMKNHENSKKHKENVALLKFLMEEEEAATLPNDEEEIVEEENPRISESDDEETSEALLEKLIRSSSSKSKKKKKKNKNIPTEMSINAEVEIDEELNSKLEEITIDDPPEELQSTDIKSSFKSNTSTKKDKKVKTSKQKMPTDDISSENNPEEATQKPVTICEKCNVNFKSRNKLFDHLKESGHAVYKTENFKQNSSSGSTKNRKKKKL